MVEIRAVQFSPDDQTVVSCYMDSTMCFWNAKTGVFVCEMRRVVENAMSVSRPCVPLCESVYVRARVRVCVCMRM